MASITHGTAHVFGVAGTVTDTTVQSFNVTGDHQLKTNTLDEQGREIERRRDDETQTGSITLRIQTGYTLPTVGSIIAYDSVNYEVDTVDRAETNGDYVAVTLSIKTSEYITL